jgi:flagellar assembly protein FliH
MTKAVFRPGELQVSDKKVLLEPPQAYDESGEIIPDVTESPELPEEVPQYTGPTVEELKQEADNFRVQWEAERDAMIKSAKAEAEGILKDAEQAAFQEVKRKTDQAQSIKQDAELEAERIISEAKAKASQIEQEAQNAFDKERQDQLDAGYTQGKEAGYQEGKAEVERLIERMQTVLQRAQDKRTEILEETEQQIIDMVMLITRKVVKVISESQRQVVISNIIQALRKVKGKGNITIRVNMNDLKLTTDHTKDFIKMLESGQNVHVAEDSSVDQGGCVIESDFGEIDARISSQLAELEDKILEMSPIKANDKAAGLEAEI